MIKKIKAFSFLLMAGCVFGLASCGSNSSTDDNTANTNVSEVKNLKYNHVYAHARYYSPSQVLKTDSACPCYVFYENGTFIDFEIKLQKELKKIELDTSKYTPREFLVKNDVIYYNLNYVDNSGFYGSVNFQINDGYILRISSIDYNGTAQMYWDTGITLTEINSDSN